MPLKLCKDCLQPFDQFSSLISRCGNCTYKRNIEIAKGSHRKAIKYRGTAGIKWSRAKRDWINTHEAEEGIYYCHYCGLPLTIEPDLLDLGVEYLTLDHMQPRGSNPHKKYLQDNLVPSCLMDNSRKGSRSYEDYCAEFYPALIDND